jgi:hypothetical protein
MNASRGMVALRLLNVAFGWWSQCWCVRPAMLPLIAVLGLICLDVCVNTQVVRQLSRGILRDEFWWLYRPGHDFGVQTCSLQTRPSWSAIPFYRRGAEVLIVRGGW